MIALNVVLLVTGFASLAVLIVIYVFDPFKWNLFKSAPITTERMEVTQPIDKSEMESITLLRKQKNCAPFRNLIENGEDIRIVGPTLSNITSSHYKILENLVKKKASLQFILLKPDWEKNRDIFQDLARSKGTGETAKDIYNEATTSLNNLLKLKARADNPEKVDIKVTDIKLDVSLVLVDPHEPKGKIVQAFFIPGFINDDRLTSEFRHCDPRVSEAYDALLSVYEKALGASDSCPIPSQLPAK